MGAQVSVSDLRRSYRVSRGVQAHRKGAQLEAALARQFNLSSDKVKDRFSNMALDSEVPPAPGVGKNTLAYYSPSSRSMVITKPTLSESMTLRHDQMQKNGWFSQCGHAHPGLERTIAHEYGHHINNVIRFQGKELEELAEDIMREAMQTTPSSVKVQMMAKALRNDIYSFQTPEKLGDTFGALTGYDLSKLVSRYGTHSGAELFAEIWAEYSMNPDARPHIKRWGAKIQDIMEKADGAR
jgi:hypothetical protein